MARLLDHAVDPVAHRAFLRFPVQRDSMRTPPWAEAAASVQDGPQGRLEPVARNRPGLPTDLPGAAVGLVQHGEAGNIPPPDAKLAELGVAQQVQCAAALVVFPPVRNTAEERPQPGCERMQRVVLHRAAARTIQVAGNSTVRQIDIRHGTALISERRRLSPGARAVLLHRSSGFSCGGAWTDI